MQETIRTFIAIELPEDVKNELSNIIEQLRQLDVRGLRPVRTEGIHLTLKFLGDIPVAQVEPINTALQHVAQNHSQFSLRLGPPGVFPNTKRPRVLWVGVEGNLEPLHALQKDVEEALASFGHRRERRGYNPHLTLARLREGTSPKDRTRVTDSLLAMKVSSELTIPAKSISFMKSDLQPGGTIHTRLVSIPI